MSAVNAIVVHVQCINIPSQNYLNNIIFAKGPPGDRGPPGADGPSGLPVSHCSCSPNKSKHHI